MTNELEDWQLALLVEARRYDDPTLVEAAEAESLRDAQNLLDEAEGKENPTVVEQRVKDEHEEAEALLEAAQGIDDWEVVPTEQREEELEACAAVEEALSEALKEQNGLRDEVVESMSAPAMVSQFRDDEEGDIDLEALSQHPETGGATEDEVEESTDPEDDPGGDIDSLSAKERQEVSEKLAKAERMEERTPDFSESLRQEAAEMVGVDSADEINVEAL